MSPGLTRNSRDFERLAPWLASRYRVICPDLRGRGLSARDPAWQNYHLGTYVAHLDGLEKGLAITRMAIIGTSLGGLLAMTIAAAAPKSIAGIVLNDVGPEIDPAGAERIRGYTGRLPPVGSWEEAIAQTREVYGRAWQGLPDNAWPELARRAYREDTNGTPVLDVDPMIGETLRAAPIRGPDLWSLYAFLARIPTLAIRGARSDILSLATFERMRREKPDLEQVTVADRGHVPLLDEPECLAAIDRFLVRLDPR